jgi:hypothetical protein
MSFRDELIEATTRLIAACDFYQENTALPDAWLAVAGARAVARKLLEGEE